MYNFRIASLDVSSSHPLKLFSWLHQKMLFRYFQFLSFSFRRPGINPIIPAISLNCQKHTVSAEIRQNISWFTFAQIHTCRSQIKHIFIYCSGKSVNWKLKALSKHLTDCDAAAIKLIAPSLHHFFELRKILRFYVT